ncbi:NAD(P)-dependent oxidoreductase [Saccharomonospora piscinae]|uniref:NAD(P)-dependent oxidoreductase n=1 Tax=Saccharomonospora piscinae TaxID=687388 RepID=A0A1V9A9N3_SACPI|nr:SDR family oxidoreductase [Saccharomonospora piscinae]OQO93634.1 NAD(P)-dependent oxidoreductase [Saccharomonospora piscinae]
MRCVVFGATGYLGGRLIPELLAAGHEVRAVARTPAKLAGVDWRDRVEVVRGDVTDPGSVAEALRGQDVVYYLVHSLSQRGFAEIDRRAAHVLADSAKDAGVTRIVYLGGITPEGQPLSEHLASRSEVGRILLDGPVPTVELRAAVVLGAGSASFEMLRYLTEHLPVMVTPRWARNRIQPIAVKDVLHYLVGAATITGDVNASFDIGGPDVLTYLDMMRRYAAVAGLRRRVILVVPVLTPWLSAQWINLVTPVPKTIALPLIESLISEVVCRDHAIAEYVPDPEGGLTGYETAIAMALARVRRADVPTRWSDATPGSPSDPMPLDPVWSGGSLYEDVRESRTRADPQALWEVVESIGGERGWYSFPLAWSVRGWIDRLTGGVGLRRGRRHPRHLRVGEALDFWRVEAVERPRLLRLRAEMRLPGRAWLELSVEPDGDGGAIYRQRALFAPKGLAGHVYWKAIAPFHAAVFGGMARNIAGTAEHGDR